jgi:putative LysE/RhtB family amino acid efflux pump
MIWTFFKGMGIGLAVAVPFGPISVLCLRQAMVNGRPAGLASGLGVALADGLYALLAALGFLLLADMLAAGDAWLRLFAGLFIVWIALSIWKSRPPAEAQRLGNRRLAATFAATFFLTLANPTTILTFIALFGGIGLATVAQERSAALVLTAGAFIGSLAWWLVLTEFGVRLRRKISASSLVWINRSAAAVLLLLALFILFQSLGAFFSRSP